MARIFYVFFLIALCCNVDRVYSYKLEKVLILSRHNLRTPLTSSLARMTPKEWPIWTEEVGYLTSKGALLESYMGQYFSAWLNDKELLPTGCPDSEKVHIYANTKQRTKATAIAFTEAAFPNCNITVNFKNMTEMDPIFNPVIRNTTESFKQLVKQEMLDKLNSSDLKDVYLELNDITDIKNSEICKEDGYCDLSTDKAEIFFKVGKEPDVTGPFFIANSMVDAFLMSYYEGLPLEKIGWGNIKGEDQWKLLTKIVKQNENVRFNLTTACRDLSGPLLKYLKERSDSEHKFTLLVGHDSNLTPLFSCMGFKPFVLPEQYELTPIGGKLVFQKWKHGNNEYLKVEFVYQSWDQLRNAEKLSLENPPKKITMFLNDCVTDDKGFCPWSDFERVINELVH